MSAADRYGTLPEAAALPGDEVPSDALGEGLALILQQRTALLERDPAGIEDANARLLAWIQDGDAGAGSLDPAGVRALRAALDLNSSLARQSALQAGRALDVLLPPCAADHGSGLYTPQGLAGGTTARRRTVRSCA